MPDTLTPLSLLTHPYTALRPLTQGPGELRQCGREPGSAVVWSMAIGRRPATVEMLMERPGGLALLVVLPAGSEVGLDPEVMSAVDRTRPHGILPYHPRPDPAGLAQVLRRPPADLGGEVTDYLNWRGIGVDRETAHVIRRIIDLSRELRSVSAVSRSLYLSRRALGRRLMSRGLPVPSHWLQAARLLRVATRLQNSDATVSSVAVDVGYPDGFSVSNQMERLFGCRPTEARERLGWEWLLEAWLRREADVGALAPVLTRSGSLAPNLREPRRSARRAGAVTGHRALRESA
ncbi:MAG: AraC family transcriptional regulator [Longimicrobiales bacterium]